MKKILSTALLILFAAALLSACASRRDRCPGVGQVEQELRDHV